MKQKLLFLSVLFATMNLFGQDEKDFRLNIGIQWNMPERYFNSELSDFNGKNSGVGLHFYPKWTYNANISLGLNIEYALVTENPRTDNIDAFDIFSFSPTFNYYFSKKNIRPFAGLGIGAYSLLGVNQKLNFGIRPIIGLAVFEKFDLSLEYSKILGDLNINPNASLGFDNYYFALKGSFSIGIKSTRGKNKP